MMKPFTFFFIPVPLKKTFVFLVLLLVLYGGTTAFGAEPTFSDLYFLTTEAQVKLLNQKLEYSVLNKDSLRIGNLVISTENFKLLIDEKEKLVVNGPLQLMVGGTLIIKDPLGRALWSHTIKKITELAPGSTHNDTPSDIKKNNTGQYVIDSIKSFQNRLETNSVFTFCIFNETQTNRIQICTPIYSLEKENDQWALKNPEPSKTENTVIVNGVEVNEHGIIQFDKQVQSVAIAINLTSGLFTEIRAVPIELEFLDLIYNEEKDEVQLKLREKNAETKENNTWITTVSVNNPFVYIESYGQIPLKQELKIDKALLPKDKDRPILDSGISKTYSSKVTLKFKAQPTLRLRPATKGDTVKKTSSHIFWNLNNLKTGPIKPHLVNIEFKKVKFVGAYEVERAPSWEVHLEGGPGNIQATSSNKIASQLPESYSSTSAQLHLSKYFDSFLGSYNPWMYLRWGLHLDGRQRTFQKPDLQTTDMTMDLSYRFNSNFHHSHPSSSLRLSALSRTQTSPFSANSETSQWIGFKWTHDGPHHFKNSFWTSLLGDNHDFQITYYALCLNTETCKNSNSFLKSSWQSRYNFKENYFWSWKVLWENLHAEAEKQTQTTRLYELNLGLGYQF